MIKFNKIQEVNDRAQTATIAKYGANSGTVGKGRVCICLPNSAGVKLICCYDILAGLLVFTLYRSYFACLYLAKPEQSNYTKYLKTRKCTYVFEILVCLALFAVYTVLLAVQNRGINVLP